MSPKALRSLNAPYYGPTMLAYLEALNHPETAQESMADAEKDYDLSLQNFFSGKEFRFTGYVADIFNEATEEFEPFAGNLSRETCFVEGIALAVRYEYDAQKYPIVALVNSRGLRMLGWLYLASGQDQTRKFLTWHRLKPDRAPDMA
jgi:hypothetical protein